MVKKNIVWFVNNVLWNKYSKGWNEICPSCFVELAESQGYKPTAWELVPEKPPKSKGENQNSTDNKSSFQFPKFEKMWQDFVDQTNLLPGIGTKEVAKDFYKFIGGNKKR